MANKDVKVIKEDLLVNGRVVADSFEGAFTGTTASAWETRVKPHLDYSEEDGIYVTDGQLTCGGDVYIDGAVTLGDTTTTVHSLELDIHGDTQIHGELVLDKIESLTNPDTAEPLVKKVAKSKWDDGTEVKHTGVIYFIWNDTVEPSASGYGLCEIRYFPEN